MKKIFIIHYSLFFIFASLLLLSCNKKDNSFSVSGDCRIEKLVLDDQYTAVVDHAARTAVVPVPEVHNDQLMTITGRES